MARLLEQTVGGAKPVGPCAVRERDHDGFIEAVGERIALLGADEGRMEVWMWPLLLVHDLRVCAGPAGGVARPLGERTIRAVPEGVGITWEGGDAIISMTAVAMQREPGLLLLFEVDLGVTEAAIDVVLTFVPALRPMWPAGLGGQIVGRDDNTGAALLSEEIGRYAALIGSPDMADISLPDRRGTMEAIELCVRVERCRDASDPIVVAVAGSTRPARPLTENERRGGCQSATGFARANEVIDDARALLQRLWSDWASIVACERERWREYLDDTPSLDTGDAELDAAFEWSKIAVERAWVDVEGVGRSVVAGYGASLGGARPGYAWFFNGDAFEACRAYAALGRIESCREILRFAARTQRHDGKLTHEISLSAGLCDWFIDYPYPYYKGNQTPEFLTTLADHVAWSGDDALLEELWPAAERAFAWCRSTTDSKGIMRVPVAGIAAVEAGPIANRLEAEVFLQGSWLSAQRAMLALAARRGIDFEVHPSATDPVKAAAPFRHERTAPLAFARLKDGALLEVATAYVALPLARGVMDATDAEVLTLNRPELTADWGGRMFSAASEIYDPEHDNMSSVFPYLTQYITLALYDRGFDDAGWQVLRSQAALVGMGGPGVMPEFLAGDRARLLPHSVPHQTFSHASLIRLVTDALFGLEPGTRNAAPRVPLELDRMALRGMRCGDERFDVRATRDPATCPRAAFPWQIDVYAPSANPRLVATSESGGVTSWTIAGPAAATVRIPFECPTGTRVAGARVEGSDLVVAFPTTGESTEDSMMGFGETTIRFVRASDA